MADDQNYLAALKRERASYVQTGKNDRAEQVDAEIARVQAALADPDVAPEEAPPVDPKPAAKSRKTTRKA